MVCRHVVVMLLAWEKGEGPALVALLLSCSLLVSLYRAIAGVQALGGGW